MRNIKLLIEYEGTKYQGFIRRDSDKTISAKLSSAILRVTGEEPEIHAAVKTDALVHALSQTVNFKTNCMLPVNDIKNALNKTLPTFIAWTWEWCLICSLAGTPFTTLMPLTQRQSKLQAAISAGLTTL